jgi:hypothetical protein
MRRRPERPIAPGDRYRSAQGKPRRLRRSRRTRKISKVRIIVNDNVIISMEIFGIFLTWF